MNQIIIGPPLTSQFEQVALPVELVDEAGRSLGQFVPWAAMLANDNCPYSPEELEAMRSEKGGRTLAEIWKSLGAE